MNLLREQDPRFVGIEKKVGVFIFAALGTIALAVAVIGARQGLFTPRTNIYLNDSSGKDLEQGMAIEISGFTVGKVSSIVLNEEGVVEATLTIDSSYMKWVRSNSKARLVKEMFIGDSKIDVTPGASSYPQLEEGDTITFERELELAEVAKGVMDEVKPVLLHIKTLIAYIADPEGDVKTTIANLRRLSGDLSGTREKIDGLADQAGRDLDLLVEGLDGVVTSLHEEVLPRLTTLLEEGGRTAGDAGEAVQALEEFVSGDLAEITAALREGLLPELRALLSKVDGTVGETEEAVAVLSAGLPEILENVEKVLENVLTITEDLKGAAADAPELTSEGGRLLDESRDLVRRTRQLWPFRDGAAPPAGETIDVDSYQRIE